MKKEEINHNYIEDLYPNFNDDETIEFEIDQKSVELNTALYKLFFAVLDNDLNDFKIRWESTALKLQNCGKGPFYSFFLNDKEFILSTDYIGPSAYQCREIAEYETAKIKEFLKKSRTLGGHLIWPRGKGRNPTVNTVKGGEVKPGCGYGFYDRIDWTLFLLKIFYQCEKEEQYDQAIKDFFEEEKAKKDFYPLEISENDNECFKRLYDAFYRSSDWFKVFKNFNIFCDFFKLTGSFVDDDHKIIWFTDSFPIKPDKGKYREYTDNNLNAIKKRNQVLEKWVCSTIERDHRH